MDGKESLFEELLKKVLQISDYKYKEIKNLNIVF